MAPLSAVALAATVAIGGLLAACDGCHRAGGRDAGSSVAAVGAPTVRLYLVSDLAGAIEPCGCQKDMLGGVNHFAALVSKQRDKAPNAAVAAAGPLFFMDAMLKPERAEQDTWKAEAIAAGLKGAGLAAFTPGKNDWSAGGPELVKLRELSGGALVAANLRGPASAGSVDVVVRDVGGVKVAFVGVSVPKSASGEITDLTIEDAARALDEAAKKARTQGSRIVVGLTALDRGEALRAAEKIPELDVLALGSSASEGDENGPPKPPRFVGPVLVVEPSNHLTRVAIVDFHVRGDGRFADGSGLAHAAERTDLGAQIDDLQKRIASWERDPNVPQKDLAVQRARLQSLRDRLAKASAPPPTPSGSFLRYELADIRDSLGEDATAKDAMASYYKRVNEFNKSHFAGKRAPTPSKGEAFYVGIDTCKTCHTAAYDVWAKTPHGHAYKTLSDQSKEFNLDCVACHVTGYAKPGGSTVTDVEGLRDVQCEQCHGPGSKHIADPVSNTLASGEDEQICAGCHHPPHTDVFEFKTRVERIRGPGHGKPGAPANVEPPKGWKPPKGRF